MTLQVGDVAPDFTLAASNGQQVSLSDFRGKKVLVFFYPFAFSRICTTEVCDLRDSMPKSEQDLIILGISCDPSYSLIAFADVEKLDYLLLSDFWPHGEVSRKYGVFIEERGMSTRGSFLIDESGVIQWLVVNAPGEARDVNSYREALASLGK